jgi:hypothetical protein
VDNTAAAQRWQSDIAARRHVVRAHPDFLKAADTVACAWSALPVPDLSVCPSCLVPVHDGAVRLPRCVHSLCAACATVLCGAKEPVLVACLLCTRTSVMGPPPWPCYLSTAAVRTPQGGQWQCATHRVRAATAFHHACQAVYCDDGAGAHGGPPEHNADHAALTTPSAAGTADATRRVGDALARASMAADELVARAAEGVLAQQTLVRTGPAGSAARVRLALSAIIAAALARLRVRRIALLAHWHMQAAALLDDGRPVGSPIVSIDVPHDAAPFQIHCTLVI